MTKRVPTKRARQVAKHKREKYASDGQELPLDVLMRAMRGSLASGNLKEAAAYAEKAAPYMHPRLSSVDATHKHDFSRLSEAELDAELAALGAGALVGAAVGAEEADEASPTTH